jgi:hypothetical protein
MSNVLKVAAVGGAVSAETDANFKQTVLLLHGDGTNGAQNNTFLDSSTNNFTITRNGNTTQGTFSPFSLAAGEWSNFFDGTGDYLSIASATALNLSTGAFTIESWVYLTSGTFAYVATRRSAATARGIVFYYDYSTKKFVFLAGDTNTAAWEVNITSTNTYEINQWVHVAITRNSGNDFTLWVNGTSQATTNSNVTIADDASNLLIGAVDAGTNSHAGYFSNWRLVKGRAVYTSTFTPSTTPLGATSGGQDPPQGTETGLLTCQSNRFVDNSSSPKTITRNGDVRVTPFSPFAPSAAYDPAVNGGSGYFDGTGDYLSIADAAALDLASGDFTIEAWIYLPVAPAVDDRLFKKWASTSGYMFFFQNNTGTLRFIYRDALGGGPDFQGAGVVIGQWNHVAVTRSTNTYNIWVNGASVANTTNTASIVDNALNLNIGGDDVLFEGYMSQARILKGTALYTSAFTPPTAPFTAITNTSLLLNFTNAGIFDNTGKNVLETVGNAQIDTTTKKYGTGSMEFDGTGDWLLVPKFWNIAASENFTIECWIYLTAAQASYRAIISDINNANLGSSKYIMISSTGLEIQTGTVAGTISTITQSFSQNTWYHLAVVRSSNTISVYVDGVSKTVSQASQSGAFLDQGTAFYIGRWASTAYEFNGFIDDLRITKGVARYPTEPFPTKAFPDQ